MPNRCFSYSEHREENLYWRVNRLIRIEHPSFLRRWLRKNRLKMTKNPRKDMRKGHKTIVQVSASSVTNANATAVPMLKSPQPRFLNLNHTAGCTNLFGLNFIFQTILGLINQIYLQTGINILMACLDTYQYRQRGSRPLFPGLASFLLHLRQSKPLFHWECRRQ